VKRFVEGVSRDQSSLVREKPDDFIAGDNRARVTEALAETLDPRMPGSKGVDPGATGRCHWSSAVDRLQCERGRVVMLRR
jgi:transposase